MIDNEQNPSERIQGILDKEEQFQTIRVIMKILINELGLPEDSKPKTIFDAINQVAKDYYAAMDEFQSLIPKKTPENHAIDQNTLYRTYSSDEYREYMESID